MTVSYTVSAIRGDYLDMARSVMNCPRNELDRSEVLGLACEYVRIEEELRDCHEDRAALVLTIRSLKTLLRTTADAIEDLP